MSVWEIRKCSVCHQPGVSRFVWRNAGWRVRIVGPDEDETGRSRWASWWEEGWLQCLTSSMPATISFVLLRIFLILLNSEKEVIKWTVWNTSLPALQKKKKKIRIFKPRLWSISLPDELSDKLDCSHAWEAAWEHHTKLSESLH